MDVARFKSDKTRSGFCLKLVLSTLVVLAVPAITFAQDDDAVALLRQIGRKFAEISENASPAVVVLTVDKPTPRSQLGTKRWKFEPGGRWLVPLPELPSNFQPIHPDLPSTRPVSPQTQKLGQKARGLGFVASNGGHILTCNHLVNDARKINAELADGQEFEA